VTVSYFKETDGPGKKSNYKLGGKKKPKKMNIKISPIHYQMDHLEQYKCTESRELQSTQMLP